MKITKYTTTLLALFFITALSCNEDVSTFVSFESYEWTDADEDGGSWKQVVVSPDKDFGIAIPESTSSDSYKAELLLTVDQVQKMTADQRKIADYWTSNPVLRWNEIARDLAAKYNLAPAPDANGVYNLPDVNNPSSYPKFPFAHPPYTCRMLAYLQVAMFDGLIECWQLNKQFNRGAPSASSSAIEPYYGNTLMPSYPSQGATATAIAQSILTSMFPLEKDYIKAKADEHLQSLIYTGLHVNSDVVAGTDLGAKVAAEVMKRAATDGMKKAQTPRPVSDSIKTEALNRFGWQWVNQEIPERPVGITPAYGNLKMWSISDVKLVRPVPPPAPGSAAFKDAVDELEDVRKNLTGEQRRIANFWSDGTSTYTPPGHWNRLACEFITEKKLNPLRSARVLAYLNMAIMDAGIACWDAKYYYHYPRPIQAVPGFKTILGTPNFPSYTSGHSTFSGAAADLLSKFFPEKQALCTQWALEASNSRIYGGIHYRFDCEAGLTAGKKVAEYVFDIAINDGAD